MAAWTAAELFAEFGGEVAIALKPSSGGRFEVDLGDDEVYNGMALGRSGIDHEAVERLKMTVHERLGV